ncbi:MAG: hypothetical protein ACPGNT_11155, partial [Rhodospirillales bacterium]
LRLFGSDLDYAREAFAQLAASESEAEAFDANTRVEWHEDLDGFTAALSLCDCVVTSSNATAHFAGGLGKACVTLLPDPPHWTWQLDRATSPWYAGQHLVRRRAEDADWRPAIERGRLLMDTILGP